VLDDSDDTGFVEQTKYYLRETNGRYLLFVYLLALFRTIIIVLLFVLLFLTTGRYWKDPWTLMFFTLLVFIYLVSELLTAGHHVREARRFK